MSQEQYKQILNWKRQQGFMDKWPEYERMTAGDQWPPATERTKNLPRPVFNFLKFIKNHKVSNVCNENVKMLFSPQEVSEPQQEQIDPMTGQPIKPMMPDPMQIASEGAEKFNKFSEFTWENIKQDDLNLEALDNAAMLGTGIWHYYWDNDTTGGIATKYIGELKGEIIDAMNFFPGNPQQRDIQKQPSNSISCRDSVANIKEIATKNKVPVEKIEMIQPDKNTNDEGYDTAKQEVTDTEMATTITKYWRDPKTKYIFFNKTCGEVTYWPDTNTGMKLYPLASMVWEKRSKSFFGVSEIEGLIPNQKAINFIIAMMLLAVQDTAWPKLKAKRGALQNKPTNTPGEIIYDELPGPGWNVDYMQPGQISNFAPLVVDKIMDFTRTLTGANEAATGDPFTKQLNAAAIIAMQNAAKIPIETIKKRYYSAIEDIGRIWEEFYKVKYNTTRSVPVKDNDGNEIPLSFNGSQYADVPMRLKIDIGPSTGFNESISMTTLDKLYDKGDIDAELYLKYAPKNVAPFKDTLIKDVQRHKALMAQQKMQEQQQAMAIKMGGAPSGAMQPV